MDTLLGVLDLAVLLGYLVGVPLCFLKGRRWFGLFGIVMFVTGMALGFQAFRYVRDGVIDDWWWWLFAIQGVAVVTLVVVVAARPAVEGSWWANRRSRAAGGSVHRS